VQEAHNVVSAKGLAPELPTWIDAPAAQRVIGNVRRAFVEVVESRIGGSAEGSASGIDSS